MRFHQNPSAVSQGRQDANGDLARITSDRELTAYPNLEETIPGKLLCRIFSDERRKISCLTEALIEDARQAPGSLGRFSLRFQGTRQTTESYKIVVPVKPATRYRVSAAIKILGRTTYNYLSWFPPFYPARLTEQNEGRRDAIDQRKGIWSGRYFLSVDKHSILQRAANDNAYRYSSNVDWFREDEYFTTKSEQKELHVRLTLQGFDGSLFLDDLRVEEVSSLIPNHYFNTPILREYQGMKVVSFSPTHVRTNAGLFSFTESAIWIRKDGEWLSTIHLGKGALKGLTAKGRPGNILLENAGVKISVGADSALLLKFKKVPLLEARKKTFLVSGPQRTHMNFEAGTIVAADEEKGILFSPLRSKYEAMSLPRRRDPRDFSQYYEDKDIAATGRKFWEVKKKFDRNGGPPWEIEYQVESGEGFTVSLFPPKEFDWTKYATERVSILPGLVGDPEADYSYMLQRFKERFNIGVVWMNDYTIADTAGTVPPEVFCKDGDGYFVNCEDPRTAFEYPLSFKNDPAGPYKVAHPEAFRRLIRQAHQIGIRILIYVTPHYYYTSDVDTFLTNVRTLLDHYNLDGVYFDGLYEGDFLRSLNLVRKARNLLGNRFLVIHYSRDMASTNTEKIKNPALEAHADQIWTAEQVKEDSLVSWHPEKERRWNIWKFNYAGRNVSNTVSVMLPEFRRVDYRFSDSASALALSLSPFEQFNRALANRGLFRVHLGATSHIKDKTFETYSYFKADDYWDRLNERVLPYTQGNGVCDIGEAMFTSPDDCAPRHRGSSMAINENAVSVFSPYSVANWEINGRPLFDLRFTFDGDLARDDSGRKYSPFGEDMPIRRASWERGIFRFDGTQGLEGEFDYLPQEVVFPRTDLSIVISAKLDSTAENGVLFSMKDKAKNGVFYLTVWNRRLTLVYKDTNGVLQSVVGAKAVEENQWHLFTLVYDHNSSTVRLYQGSELVAQEPVTLHPLSGHIYYSIGRHGQQHLEGWLDDLAMASRAFTQSQIQVFANHGFSHLQVPSGATAQPYLVSPQGEYFVPRR